MAKGKSGGGSKAAPKVQDSQKLRQKANELRAQGRLLEAKADIIDAKKPPPKNGRLYGGY